MPRAHRLLLLPFVLLLHAACGPAARMLFASPQSEPIETSYPSASSTSPTAGSKTV